MPYMVVIVMKMQLLKALFTSQEERCFKQIYVLEKPRNIVVGFFYGKKKASYMDKKYTFK
ncbi:hypothetical protein GCM10023330_21560 [Litoribaculum gwangyangense]|uniref:Uncharacterized protein n=1 Tax=Litoribaculum gwangyangense TaxID=1130722 RepID=A0ABP9CL93_9FLAO